MWDLKTVKLSGDKYYAEINRTDALLIKPGLPMSPDEVTIRFNGVDDMDTWVERIVALKALAIEHFGDGLAGGYLCQLCSLSDTFSFWCLTLEELKGHVLEHIESGDTVPDRCLKRIEMEMSMNCDSFDTS